MLTNLDNKTVKLQNKEKLWSILLVKISKHVNNIEMHPNRTCKDNNLNVAQEHRAKIGNLIHSNRDVVANSDKVLKQTQLFQLKIISYPS